MKKILLFFMGLAVAAFASAADYYLIGGFNGWATSDAGCKFTPKGNDVYELNYSGTLTSGFKVNDGTWSNDNINFGSNGEKLVVGTPYNYGVGGGTANIAMDGAVTNPKITLNVAAGTLLIQGAESEAKVSYCIHGQIGGNADWADIVMTESNGNWTVTLDNAVAGDFGIKQLTAGNQSAWFSADGDNTISAAGTYMAKEEGVNWTSSLTGKVTFTFNPNALTLVVSTDGGSIVTPPTPGDYTGWYVNLGCDNWNTGNDDYWKGVAVSADGKVSWTGLAIGDAEFAIKLWNGSADSFYYAENIVVGTPTAMTYSATQVASTIAGAAAGDTFDVTYDCATNTITITKVGGGDNPGPVDPVDPTPGDYTGWYVNLGCDNWNTGNDDYWKGVAVPNDGIVSWTGLEIGDAEFAIKLWNGTADSFYYAENIPVDVETVMTVATVQTASTIAGAAAGDKFDVVYNVASNTIKITKAGGVSGVELEAASAEAEYYTLQGVKVANPANGLYIKVENGKATKVLVK